MIKIPKYFTFFFGETLRFFDIFWILVYLVLGNLLSFFVDQNFYMFTPIKAFIFTLFLSENIIANYMHTTVQTNNYFNKNEHLLRALPLLSIYPIVYVFLFDVPFYLPILIYIFGTLSTFRILTLTKYKGFFAWVLIMIGAFIFGLVEDGHSLSFALGMFLYVLKVIKVFGSRHYLACPLPKALRQNR